MVAYSFQRRFVAPIALGLGVSYAIDDIHHDLETASRPKRQTVRADRKRHARPGEEIQLYCGMRTKHCFLIGRAVCKSVEPIKIRLDIPAIFVGADRIRIVGIPHFARSDGFRDWNDMRAFWAMHHPGVSAFEGVLIKWEPRRDK